MNTKHRLGATSLEVIVVALVAIAAATPILAQNPQQEVASSVSRPETNPRTYVPDTVSEGWQQVFEAYADPTKAARCPRPNDLEGWKKLYDATEQRALKVAEEAAKKLQVNVAGKELGGVPVLEVTPKDWVE